MSLRVELRARVHIVKYWPSFSEEARSKIYRLARIASATGREIHHRSHMSRDHLPLVREEPDDVEKLSIEQVEVKSLQLLAFMSKSSIEQEGAEQPQ